MSAGDTMAWQSAALSCLSVAVGFAALLMRSKEPEHAPQTPQVLTGMGLERVLVLRVARALERSEGLVHDAEHLGVPLEFLNATDGRHNEYFRSHVLPLSLPEGDGTCTDLIGAIFDSHERAWALAAAATRPVLVLEDDVRLPPDFVDTFSKRIKELPDGWHIAFVGTSITPQAKRISPQLSRPDDGDVNKQALLGMWAYVLTPKGAQRLLNLAKRSRRFDRRLFQPVDLFVAHRLKQLEVYVFEPGAALATRFEKQPDRHHVLESMRQAGLVTLTVGRSLNKAEQDEETQDMQRLLSKVVELGNKNKYKKGWKTAWNGLKKMRMYSCWSAGPLLQNTGLLLMNMLQSNNGPSQFGGANETLLTAMEAFASSARYTEGTWMERKKVNDYPSWIRHALALRARHGLPEVAPPDGWDERVSLPCGGWLDPRTPSMAEAQSHCRGGRAPMPAPAPAPAPASAQAPGERGQGAATPAPPQPRPTPTPRPAPHTPPPQRGKGDGSSVRRRK